ncbi:MAG: hypothetical protein IPM55_10840 [Acidobacteria bacterium]|nr:hypothetical protein [Acidobacteriota bacterium]
MDRLHAFAAVLINITPDHLDRYDSMDDYAAAKARIFAIRRRKTLRFSTPMTNGSRKCRG